MARLADGVNVIGPDGRLLVGGSEVDEDTARALGAHVFEDGVHPFPETEASETDGPPPKAGPGSSADAWSKYADTHGVDVADDAKREDIIAACDAAGVPTE